jgi:phosphinothricin acetyltransferase
MNASLETQHAPAGRAVPEVIAAQVQRFQHTTLIHISAMTSDDWLVVETIYWQGIRTGKATFAVRPPASWQEWCAGKLNACSLVARVDRRVVGWAALSPISERPVYAGVAKVSVYVQAGMHGQGIGGALMQALIERSEAQGIWTLQAKILPENDASLRLHCKYGFRRVGIREKLGKMDYGPYRGQWRDVILMERRSKVVGV